MAIKGKHNIKKQQNLHNKTAEELKEMYKQDDMNARERQISLTDGQHKQNVLEKVLMGTPIFQACKECGIPQSTFRGWIFHDPQFTEAYKQVRLGEKLMLVMKSRETLNNLLDNDETYGKYDTPVVSASVKLATAQFVLGKMDGDFKDKTSDPIPPSTDNPEEAFLIIETVSDSKAWHDGTGKGNMVVVVELDGEDVRSGVRGKSDEEDFLEDE